MKLKTYYQSLDDAQKDQFSIDSGYERSHIEAHLMHARKVPRREKMPRLYIACRGNVSWREILDHFYDSVMPDTDNEKQPDMGIAA